MAEVQVDIDGVAWDEQLALLGGHPWQTAHWAAAQRDVAGVRDRRLLVREGSEVKQMVRIEERHVRGLGKVAWIRRGPTGYPQDRHGLRPVPVVSDWLKERGFFLSVASPWCPIRAKSGTGSAEKASGPRTIWLDLSVGRDALWANLQRYWRAGVRRAERRGVVVETTQDPALIRNCYALCRHVSQVKGFTLRLSPKLIERLINTASAAHAEAHLFVAMCNGRVAACALIARCGRSVHYMAGASDRDFSSLHPGEALHWAVVEWALSRGCMRYDLEGIDPDGNPGVYAFKKKMGGEEITLAPRQVYPLNMIGHVFTPMAKQVLNSQPTALMAFAQNGFSRLYRPPLG